MKDSLEKVLANDKKKNVVIYGGLRERRGTSKKLSLFQVYWMDLDIPVIGGDEERLYSFADAAEKQIDAFVVMRQMIANKDTFLQMMEYCKEYHADIYDINGKNLGLICSKALKTHNSNVDMLLQEIESHEYISFDIFDTLLMRKLLLPEDVFELTARRMKNANVVIKGFKEKRIRAQERLGLSNPDIFDIYNRLGKMYKIDSAALEQYCKMEIEVEAEVLTVRKDMLAIYQKCLDMGKKVSLVSDMYIPECVLVPILKKNGITNYDKLYLSCDRKQLKLQGLLNTYKNQKPRESYLHIGDHYIHDGICAELAGIDYCLVENAYKAAMKTPFQLCIQTADTFEERVMLGLIISKIMNSPFSGIEKDGTIEIHSDYEYSYAFCAALVSKFALWLYSETKKEGVDEILFASRDGFLVKKMYEILLEKREDGRMPRGKYFYTSRKAAVMTGINNEALINMIIDISPDMPPKKMMRERFGLRASEILEYDAENYGDSIHKYVWDHVKAIFRRAEEAKMNYYKYMGNMKLEIGKKYAFMDFVSSGTSQKSLMRITPFQMVGLYAGWNGIEDSGEEGIKALFKGNDTFFMRRFKVMETFMTSEEPSLNCFDKNGMPVFAYQDRDETELKYVREMQNACLDFFNEFLKIDDPEMEGIHNSFVDSIFAASEGGKITCQDSVLKDLRLMDDWRKKKNKIRDIIQ